MWRQGNTTLNLGGESPILRMATMHTLTCPVCLHCKGKVRKNMQCIIVVQFPFLNVLFVCLSMELGLLHVWIQCFNRCKHHRRLCSYRGVLLTLHTIAYMIITTPCTYVCMYVCVCVQVKNAIYGLTDLMNAKWTNFQINVTISGQRKYVLLFCALTLKNSLVCASAMPC